MEDLDRIHPTKHEQAKGSAMEAQEPVALDSCTRNLRLRDFPEIRLAGSNPPNILVFF